MAENVLDMSATILCLHGGSVTPQASNNQVTIEGQPILVVNDTFSVSGCPFTTPVPKPQPCVTLQWIVPAKRVTVNGTPVLLQDSSGLGLSAEQIPQGSPQIVTTQIRVKGT